MVSCPTSTCAIFLVEELLELAVRNGVDLGEAQPQGLDHHHAEEGRKNVPGRKLVLALLRLLRRTASRLAFSRRGARCLAISKQLQESPTRRGFFRILRRLIEHVGLRWRHVSYLRRATVEECEKRFQDGAAATNRRTASQHQRSTLAIAHDSEIGRLPVPSI